MPPSATTVAVAAFAIFIAVPSHAEGRSEAPKSGSSAASQWMKSMSLRDEAAQLISMACYGEAPSRRSDDYKKFRDWVRDLRIGGRGGEKCGAGGGAREPRTTHQ